MANEAGVQRTEVAPDELLYRSVKDSEVHHNCDANGYLLTLGVSAFNDPSHRPSVDRAHLRYFDPSASRRADEDGVVGLLAGDVRQIGSVVTNDPTGRPTQVHAVDVQHDPVPDNDSHALVIASPALSSGNAFRRLKEALCQLAQPRGWLFKPLSVRRITPDENRL